MLSGDESPLIIVRTATMITLRKSWEKAPHAAAEYPEKKEVTRESYAGLRFRKHGASQKVVHPTMTLTQVKVKKRKAGPEKMSLSSTSIEAVANRDGSANVNNLKILAVFVERQPREAE